MIGFRTRNISILFCFFLFAISLSSGKRSNVPLVNLRLGTSLNLNTDDIKEGDDVYFECLVQANPRNHKLAWFQNDIEIFHNSAAGVIMSNHSLVLQNIARSTAGHYTCMATNLEGTGVSNPVKLVVRYVKTAARRGQTGTQANVFVLFGASGDLARKEIYPKLWWLYREDLLAPKTTIIGYARSKISIEDIRKKCETYMEVKAGEQKKYEEFWKLNYFISGQYNLKSDFERLNQEIEKYEDGPVANRVLYLALPPSVYEDVTVNIKNTLMGKKGWTRVVIEKPFGRDLATSDKLDKHLSSLFTENQLYRMDHYLGKEMVQNLLALRFANRIFHPIWNKENVASVRINFIEPFGAQGRGGYFDEFGIIRDIIQNHVLQILTLVAMEKPASYRADDIKTEKVKLLKNIPPVQMKDVVLGQYVGNPNGEGDAKLGYLDDPTVPKNSTTSTYAILALKINNKRWNGVPFIIECGKALNDRKVEVVIQFKDAPENIFGGKLARNELVIRIQPDEAISMKFMVKSPGLSFELKQTEMNLNYSTTYPDVRIPEAYERILLDVFSGSQINFVRNDELRESWKIFTPLLHQIEEEQVSPIPYMYGSAGPKESESLLRSSNFLFETHHEKTINRKG